MLRSCPADAFLDHPFVGRRRARYWWKVPLALASRPCWQRTAHACVARMLAHRQDAYTYGAEGSTRHKVLTSIQSQWASPIALTSPSLCRKRLPRASSIAVGASEGQNCQWWSRYRATLTLLTYSTVRYQGELAARLDPYIKASSFLNYQYARLFSYRVQLAALCIMSDRSVPLRSSLPCQSYSSCV